MLFYREVIADVAIIILYEYQIKDIYPQDFFCKRSPIGSILRGKLQDNISNNNLTS